MMADRVMLFLDYQNVYMGGRRTLDNPARVRTHGQIDPVALAERIVAASPFPRVLEQVRVYRGLPDATRDPKGNEAASRQNAVWSQDPRVRVKTRTLKYPRGWPTTHGAGEKPQEKGIDVALAIDFVRLAVEGRYEVGVLMSTDTDLKPALEFVHTRGGVGTSPRAEVAAWSNPDRQCPRLSVAGAKVWCHWLDRSIFTSVSDQTNYAEPLAP